MKTVLFCGGLGTRIRDVSESIPTRLIEARPAHGLQARRLLASNGHAEGKQVLEGRRPRFGSSFEIEVPPFSNAVFVRERL